MSAAELDMRDRAAVRGVLSTLDLRRAAWQLEALRAQARCGEDEQALTLALGALRFCLALQGAVPHLAAARAALAAAHDSVRADGAAVPFASLFNLWRT